MHGLKTPLDLVPARWVSEGWGRARWWWRRGRRLAGWSPWGWRSSAPLAQSRSRIDQSRIPIDSNYELLHLLALWLLVRGHPTDSNCKLLQLLALWHLVRGRRIDRSRIPRKRLRLRLWLRFRLRLWPRFRLHPRRLPRLRLRLWPVVTSDDAPKFDG